MKSHKIKPVDTNPNFVEEEEKLLKHFYDSGIVDKYLHKNDKSEKRFSFFDGPITANNPMGLHHGWGRTYKDLWPKYKNLQGYKQRFQNGFDCQGLWVEVEVEKDLDFHKKQAIEEYGVAKFVQKCKERVLKYSAIQTGQSKRLGYFADWDNSYYTMSDENNYMIWHFLKVCHENGWIYKGHESVPWCPRCRTAISQHEMLTEDYKEVVHKSIVLQLPIEGRKDEYLLVWTTTPWTIPANIAVAVDVKLDYSLVEGNTNDKFWVAKDAMERIFKTDFKCILKTVKGKELVGLKYAGPFDELPAATIVKTTSAAFHTVVATDSLIMPINTSEGTGLVHTAVSAGTEDFKLGKLRGLPIIPVIDDEANYLPGLGWLEGKNAKKHPELILDHLQERDAKGENWVFSIENYKHRYPGCWRCKTELVWKIADEWYIAMDKKGTDGRTLRSRMQTTAKKIKWLPEFGLERELDWLTNMHDWLISKPNRYWGLALPIYECSCGHFQVLGSKEELQKKAVEGWDEFEGLSPHKPQIDQVKITCEKCHKKVSRIPDVGNVWLDAGIIP
ncbi:MAG: class I tRNA ligase family protein, partial [bacterium]